SSITIITQTKTDPSSNRIAQWLEKSIDGGILDLSHPMIPEAVQGNYRITALTDKGERISHSFEIKEYVLPKYEVKVHLPNVITILDKEATLKICGKYTYGKPVLGAVKAVFCRNTRSYWYLSVREADLCKTYQMTQSLLMSCDLYVCFHPGVILKGSGSTRFSNVIRTVTFEDIPAAYKPGIPFEGKVISVGSSLVLVEYLHQHLTCHLCQQARFKKNEPYVSGVRRPEYRSAHHSITAFYSKSSSFLKLVQVSEKLSCDKDATVRAQFIIQGDELKTGQEHVLNVFYIWVVMSHRHISFSLCVCRASVNKGEFSISLHQVTNMAPFAQVVVYTVMPSGEAVADSDDFPIQLCLNNKVSLQFSSLQQLPAEKTTLSLQAHPGSVCSVRAIDQSVLLLQPEQELTVNYVRHQSTSATSSVKLLLFYFINVFLDFLDFPVSMAFNVMPQNSGVSKSKEEEKKETIRTFFPETWIWDLVTVGDSGSVNVEKTVPDTITNWAAGAFCASSVGFGIAPNIALTAFQPFFVSLTLPYSVIRGEVFTLKATVFNYLSKCIMVKVTLADSEQYTFRNCDGCLYSVCLCGEESTTFSWILTPTTLGEVKLKVSAEALKTDTLCGNEVATVPDMGRIDTVVRTLKVEVSDWSTVDDMLSEGLVPFYGDLIFFLFSLLPEGPVEKNISLLLPEMFVAGSARASVSVLGDLMGRAMKNLDRLLAMPYGCGEQNMVLFAPNIFILNYLKSTGQLTQDIQDKATRFLESGYQRELTYKHDDGSYSAFGKNDESGNTWLTSFVMKSFGGARPYIFVDSGHINSARKWLSKQQRPDGCIKSVGKLFHNGMKGGVSDDVSLTAYITAALLELGPRITDPVVQNCLSCLKEAVVSQLDNLYTTALLSYTFTLAGDLEMRNKLITYLHQKSNAQGGTRHWERPGASGKGLDSLEVEMTSYVLLALLSGPPMPDFGLDYTSGIVRWLTQQQNPYGGFSSTQDTVVALQALAKYGAATYSSEGTTTVTVTSLGGLKKEFTVDQGNRLLYQEEKLTEVPGEYTVRAQGQSCVLAQVWSFTDEPDNLNTTVHMTHKHVNVSVMRCLVCVHRYQGRREETNMVIINIKLLSGYILDKSSLNLVSHLVCVCVCVCVWLQLKKEESKIYSVTVEEDLPVRNLKPAVVKVYDYYQTSDEAVTDYTSPCAESM
uniref:Alpha-2-macroglobulin-like n=1 Tax=Mastacembelus armatus TaxID=205130 RepID=A0A7N8WY82_9TELE